MTTGDNARSKACLGAETISVGNYMEQCVYCGVSIAWHFVDHPWFGFQGCEEKEELTEDDRE